MEQRSNARILIVEDEGVVAKDIQRRLVRLGYLVVGPVDAGDEAVEAVGRLSPDLILMDIKLRGDMDGVEAASQIRERFDVPVVYLTAYADDRTLERAGITEPFGYIVKPFRDRELHSSIAVALQSTRQRRHWPSRKSSLGIFSSIRSWVCIVPLLTAGS